MIVEQITRLIHAMRHEPSASCPACARHIASQLEPIISNQAPLVFVLPAFPAKSVNHDKTLGHYPDLGERLALTRLETLCEKISAIYKPGASMLICSDGRVFNDLVQVPEHHVEIYNEGIKAHTRHHGFNHIKFYDLKDAFPTLSLEEARDYLMQEYAVDVAGIKRSVKENNDMNQLFNGLHRFMLEDISYIYPGLSRNAIRNKSKDITYLMMQRSQAWSALIANYFPNTFRLSIHDYSCGSEKFGIKLLPSQEAWATPWHNVVLKQGELVKFVKNKVAQSLQATLIFYEGIPSHYEMEDTKHAF